MLVASIETSEIVRLVQGRVACVWTDDVTSDVDVGAATVIMNMGPSAEAADEGRSLICSVKPP